MAVEFEWQTGVIAKDWTKKGQMDCKRIAFVDSITIESTPKTGAATTVAWVVPLSPTDVWTPPTRRVAAPDDDGRMRRDDERNGRSRWARSRRLRFLVTVGKGRFDGRVEFEQPLGRTRASEGMAGSDATAPPNGQPLDRHKAAPSSAASSPPFPPPATLRPERAAASPLPGSQSGYAV
ncbi:hypothetical protein B296_00012605 [Ensete ventricosum]|uniref:Uncharacterized protein n=1 Tax=Ensete ventricosum TaxID=4639 RepID=A0A427A7R5_ENSVE|nr:hypothetical protein B296_00012605 [Ensete ventricosum]